MNYKLEIKSFEGNGASMLIDYIDEYNKEAIENGTEIIDEKQLTNLHSLYYNEVKELNGKHVIFGAIEVFEQSENCPDWYDRANVVYSFKKI